MARRNYTATIVNNTGVTLLFDHICKGTDEDPTGGEHDHLYHGEIVTGPTRRIDPHQEGSFTAKSTGSTIQGTVVYNVEGSADVWMYFHVGHLDERHSESKRVEIEIKHNGGMHPIAIYTVT